MATNLGKIGPVTVDIIDDAFFIGPALQSFTNHARPPLIVRRTESNWIPYIADFDDASGVVIVRSNLADHVPAVLKVRALSRIGARPIVLTDKTSAAFTYRLAEAGAAAVFNRTHHIDDIVAAITQPRGAETLSVNRGGCSDAKLSDRELQVACLYVGRAAPSTTVLAQLLGIPALSVRTYLQRARTALRAVGPTSTRQTLRQTLITDGWLEGE
ncbi:hypothetical protein [Microbacterium sp. YY-01]|uniref:hypothetical protein n=1 Tax=Microbacterium sp. YY-01 TaxID=3421634 RepID=UPI003D185772